MYARLLNSSNVGCYWGGHFAGAVCYVNDVVLLDSLLRLCDVC